MITDHEIVQAVFALKAQYPQLCVDALCYDGPPPYRDGVEQIVADALRNRNQVQPCIDWIGRRKRAQTFCRQYDTYSYKHAVEYEVGFWVSHMSFLVAVQVTGVVMEADPDRLWAGSLKISPAGIKYWG